MKTVLTIAGSDSSGGAGIQADIKTIMANGVFATSALTALTAQNTCGVKSIFEISPEFLKDQIEAVFEDIRPDAVKIGMVANSKLIKAIVQTLKFYDAKNIVLDPVMVSTSGSKLISDEALDTLVSELLPIATIITPNIYEAEILSNLKISGPQDMQEAAKEIFQNYNTDVLLKGGHSINDANDYLYSDRFKLWIEGTRIDNPNTHGTGCTLSSAIASNLAKGYDLKDSVIKAKSYLSDALNEFLDLGSCSGPLSHGFNIKGEYSW